MTFNTYLKQIDGNDKRFLLAKTRPDYESLPDPVKVVDVFAGCGGLTLGLAEACRALRRGISIELAVEWKSSVFDVYCANFKPKIKRASSVTEWFNGQLGAPLTPEEHATKALVGAVDFLVGGPPCQGHSNLNNHTRGRDPKNALYDRMVRAAEVLSPKHIIVENVPSLQLDRDSVLDRCATALKQLGYAIDHSVVNVADVGVPQLRKRHVLVGSLKRSPNIGACVTDARLQRQRNLRWAIGDIAKIKSDALIDRPSVLSPENVKRAKWLRKNRKHNLDNKRRPPCHRDKPDHKYKSMYGRLWWRKPAQTITSGFGSPGQGRYLHPQHLRTLTAHEAARIQFLPDWFSFAVVKYAGQLQEIIGNVVPPKLAYVLAYGLLSESDTDVCPRRAEASSEQPTPFGSPVVGCADVATRPAS